MPPAIFTFEPVNVKTVGDAFALLVKPAYPTTSFANQTIIVTGSNVGLGKEAARHFARLNAAKIILAVRNTKAGEAAKADIEATTKSTSPSTTIEVWPLDLSSYASVQTFAKRAAETLPRIDVLLSNAGIAGNAAFAMSEGHERMITVNVISTFLLALLLLPKLRASAQTYNIQPRITVVSSEVHAHTTFPERDAPSIFAALDKKEDMRGDRYPISKLLEVLVIRHLAPMLRGENKEPDVILNMLNPGLCHSELSRGAGWQMRLMKFLLARTTEVGSRTLVAAAAAGQESHGKYMGDGVVADEKLSEFVRSEEGNAAGEKVWMELCEILEAVQKGVTKV